MNVYPGQELMGHPDLQVDLSDMAPLITPESLKELENEYLKVNFSNYSQLRWIRTVSNYHFFRLDYGKELRRLDDKNG